MTWQGTLLALSIAVGGGLGSCARYAVDRAVGPKRFPWGITLVNTSGSLLLGLLVGVLASSQAGGISAAAELITSGGLGAWSPREAAAHGAEVAQGAAGGAWAPGGAASSSLWLGIGAGLLGGFTTLSTASLDTVRLARERRPLATVANAFGTLGVSVALAIAGMAAGMALARLCGAG